jgi:hypothetical protein
MGDLVQNIKSKSVQLEAVNIRKNQMVLNHMDLYPMIINLIGYTFNDNLLHNI